MSRQFDLVVVGGGIIGCAVAYQARSLFERIAIVDQARSLGAMASSAAIGGITPQSDDICGTSLSLLADQSRALYPAWLREIENEAAVSIPLHTAGLLQVALSGAELDRLGCVLVPEWISHGFEVVPCSPDDLQDMEPLLTRRAKGAFLLPREASLEPTRLLSALDSVLRRDARVTVLTGATVEEMRSTQNNIMISIKNGKTLSCHHAVLAAGLGSGRLLPARNVDPMFPVKGQAMEFQVPGAVGYPLRFQLYAKVAAKEGTKSSYLVPRGDGRVAAGVTYEYGTSDSIPSRAGYESVLTGVTALVPAARSWPIQRHWSGVRPATLDERPIIGPVTEDARVIAATGHFGLGVTLAPATAELVCSLLGGRGLTVEQQDTLDLCKPARFIRDHLAQVVQYLPSHVQ
ncbi:FAD-dependent oxidoreductase [Frankia sp. Cppng1_Ct_nod]|uniref:NAD(P)/FAD-dependent oxidoreductase n=1 Tax=Frankia sp. Cppng1_Ct_nod TaxID=2897162 RepID=UPI0010411388|nr:FAD-dependent oxidoreductase [Frankia sp. Cppng1_Ct_nod]